MANRIPRPIGFVLRTVVHVPIGLLRRVGRTIQHVPRLLRQALGRA